MALPVLAAAFFLSAGCSGNSTTNEDAMANTKVMGGGKEYKSYGEAMLEKGKDQAAQVAATKGKKGSAPAKPAETPKSEEENPK
jgi:hypothetical protein